MNLFKKIGLLVIAGVSFFTLASCDNKNNNNNTPNNTEETGFDYDKANFTSIALDETTVKKTFYLGESFTSEGLTANANFVLYNADGTVEKSSFKTTDLTIDSSNVDFYNVGRYPVKATYRYGKIVRETTYDVDVISSEYDASGVEYVGGIEVTYVNKKVYDYDLDATGTKTINLNQFRVKVHYYKSGAEIEEKAEIITDRSLYGTTNDKKIYVDYSNVNLSKKGTYIAKVTYAADPVVINGQSKPNVVKSFVVINVNDQVETFSFYSGTTSFVADVNDIDFSDWKFEVTRKISGKAIVDYNPEMFEITGISPFVVGNQKASVICFEKANLAKEVPVVITESPKYTIVTGNIYDVSVDGDGNPVYGGEVFTKAEDLTNATEGTHVLDSTGMFKITNITKYEDRKAGADKYGSLNFGVRMSVKGAASFSITVTGPAKIVIYAASTGDNSSRDVGLYDAAGNLLYDDEGNELQYFTDDRYLKQHIEQFMFEVKEAGTYYLKSELQIYFHGCVVAMEK